jgi:7,8-dihydropterin-6-yl-methyl-4-(beta-D-ribofuranosyl)aminobenzene 5'-phosphate synthase
MGGFHLKKNDLQTMETISYLEKNAVKHVCPSHCTALPAWIAFSQNFNINLIRTGDILKF